MRATQLALRRADARVQERGAHCGVLADGRHRFFSVRLRRRALTTDPWSFVNAFNVLGGDRVS